MQHRAAGEGRERGQSCPAVRGAVLPARLRQPCEKTRATRCDKNSLDRLESQHDPASVSREERGDAVLAAGLVLGKWGSAVAVPGRWVPEQGPAPTWFVTSGLVFDA